MPISHEQIINIDKWAKLNRLHPSIEKHLIGNIAYIQALPKHVQIRISPISESGKLCAKYWEPKTELFVLQGCLTQAQYAGLFMNGDQVELHSPYENRLKELEPLIELLGDKPRVDNDSYMYKMDGDDAYVDDEF